MSFWALNTSLIITLTLTTIIGKIFTSITINQLHEIHRSVFQVMFEQMDKKIIKINKKRERERERERFSCFKKLSGGFFDNMLSEINDVLDIIVEKWGNIATCVPILQPFKTLFHNFGYNLIAASLLVTR